MNSGQIMLYFTPFALLALSAIVIRLQKKEWYFAFKPLPMIWILGFYGLHLHGLESISILQYWILAGVFFGLLGDIFLLYKKSIIPGFVFFLLGHLLYLLGFFRGNIGLPVHFWPLVFIPALAVPLWMHKHTHTPRYRPLIWVYCLFEGSMLFLAMNLDYARGVFPFLTIGAALFGLSDVFWALNRMVREFRSAGLFVLSTYYTGQALIVFSAMQAPGG
ncbi:MAG: lysoplasmalogenase [Leptospiraceae bacterium]|nr:lysoplasmalogenase [Leptospiraceae bacterium]